MGMLGTPERSEQNDRKGPSGSVFFKQSTKGVWSRATALCFPWFPGRTDRLLFQCELM